jgi:hypothetical protein
LFHIVSNYFITSCIGSVVLHSSLFIFVVAIWVDHLTAAGSLGKLRQGKSVCGGKDLALSAAYTSQFAAAIFAAWFRAWVLR